MKPIEPLAPLSLWGLDSAITFLNNGSFGAPPLEILRKRARLAEALERNPVDALAVDYPGRLPALEQKMAEFVGADVAGFVFVPNATFAANAVLGSLNFSAESEVVVFPHRYPAVGSAAQWFTGRAGARVVTTSLPESLTSKQQLIDVYEAALNSRTALVIVDHISSLSGIVFPVEEIVALCRQKKIPVLVDGAHAPGQVELALEKWQPDFYTGNFHKWLFGPRPAAFLYVAKGWRDRIHPPVISNYYGKGFKAEFAWCGTFDPTPLFCVEDGLAFHRQLGGPQLAQRNHALAAYGGELLLKALGSRGYYATSSPFFASMFATPLPKRPKVDAPTLRQVFLREEKIEVHFAPFENQIWIRLAAQAFNSGTDMERLAVAVKKHFG